ncbi:MAG: hypothetical protein R3F11_02695 [Verrucomicrobiales bacterium]
MKSAVLAALIVLAFASAQADTFIGMGGGISRLADLPEEDFGGLDAGLAYRSCDLLFVPVFCFDRRFVLYGSGNAYPLEVGAAAEDRGADRRAARVPDQPVAALGKLGDPRAGRLPRPVSPLAPIPPPPDRRILRLSLPSGQTASGNTALKAYFFPSAILDKFHLLINSQLSDRSPNMRLLGCRENLPSINIIESVFASHVKKVNDIGKLNAIRPRNRFG